MATSVPASASSSSTAPTPTSASSTTDTENRGPLTTTFTPPPSCLSTYFHVTVTIGTVGHTNLALGHYFQGDQACYPSSTLASSDFSKMDAWNTYYYSPGYDCPRGWQTVATLGTSWQDLTLTGSTSGVLCCPQSMTYITSAHECKTSIQPGAVIAISEGDVVVRSTITAATYAFADGIPLIWQADQRPVSTSVPTTLPTAATTTAASTSTIPSASSPSSSGSSGLSEGAKVGLGVGISLGVVAIAGALGGWWFLRRRKGRAAATTTAAPKSSDAAEKYTGAELDASAGPYGAQSSELSSAGAIHELPAHGMSEMEG